MTRGSVREASFYQLVLDSDLLVKRIVHWISGIQLLLAEL